MKSKSCGVQSAWKSIILLMYLLPYNQEEMKTISLLVIRVIVIALLLLILFHHLLLVVIVIGQIVVVVFVLHLGLMLPLMFPSVVLCRWRTHQPGWELLWMIQHDLFSFLCRSRYQTSSSCYSELSVPFVANHLSLFTRMSSGEIPYLVFRSFPSV